MRRMENHGVDRMLLFTILAMSIVGIVMVYSASYDFAIEATESEDAGLFLRHHIIRVILGFILLVLFMKVREDVLRRLAGPVLIAALVLLGLVLIPSPLRVVVRGSARWLRLGYFVFQPSELAKIALILYLADFITRRGYEIRKFSRGFLPAFIVIGSAVVLVAAEPNIGTAAMLLLIGIIVLFAGGARIEHLGLGLSAALASLIGFMYVTGHNWDRLLAKLGGAADQGVSYQARQAVIAIGAGGWRGMGPGMGNQKYLFVPDAHTDFILSITGEEIGFLGILGVTALFFVFVWRGLRAARRAPSVFSSVVATGVTMAVATYFCVNAGVCTGLLPTIGLPIPFLSYGGSSSLILLASCGMLLGVSKRQSTYAKIGPGRLEGLAR
ncbi:MAG: putative peptidoglycan glycosyltransferase FtsW [bacterium]